MLTDKTPDSTDIPFLSGVFGSVNRLHCGEQQNIPDRRAVRKKHYKPVKTQAQTACGRHTVFQCGNKILVYGGVSALSTLCLSLLDRKSVV